MWQGRKWWRGRCGPSDWEPLRRTGLELGEGNFRSHPMLRADLPRWVESWPERVCTKLLVTEGAGNSQFCATDLLARAAGISQTALDVAGKR